MDYGLYTIKVTSMQNAEIQDRSPEEIEPIFSDYDYNRIL